MFAKFTHQGPISLTWFNKYNGMDDRLHALSCAVQILHTLNLPFIHVQNAVGRSINMERSIQSTCVSRGFNFFRGSRVHQYCHAVNSASRLRGTKMQGQLFIYSRPVLNMYDQSHIKEIKNRDNEDDISFFWQFVTHDSPIFWSSVLKREKYSFLNYFHGRNEISKKSP